MPSFAGILTREELNDLIAFLESRVAPPAQTPDKGEHPLASAQDALRGQVTTTKHLLHYLEESGRSRILVDIVVFRWNCAVNYYIATALTCSEKISGMII